MSKKNRFPIVGVGASAGGLEAFISLVGKVPDDAGLAFVLVQHLDPTHPSMSAEIIGRSSQLPVTEVRDGTRVKPNHVYVIPPNTHMKIHGGVLKLLPGIRRAGRPMAIDFFLESLAKSEGDRAIGIVLSGTGSDGTGGLRAIKDAGGLTFAQEPKSAKYGGMPEAAIAAEAVDSVLRPENMAAAILDGHYKNTDDHPTSSPAIQKIFAFLETHTKVDFAQYKNPTVRRRIQRRMITSRAQNLAAYVKYLKTHPEEVHALYNDLLINVTEFFRDPESFKAITHFVFPHLMKNRSPQDPIRIWVPGCATGDEVYSIAISLIEFLDGTKEKPPIQIFATDISEPTIQKARAGFYPESIAKNVSKYRLKRFFEKSNGGYKIHKLVRDICLFSIHDVTRDPPFAKLDLISCRNVLIYFSPALQKKVLPSFHYALKPNGFLWLGRSEGPGEFSKLFKLVEKSHKIFSKSRRHFTTGYHVSKSPPRQVAPISRPPPLSEAPDFRKDADKIVLSRYSPPGVVINADLEILQFRGRSVPFLEPSTGRPNTSLLKMARTELLPALRSLIQSAKKSNRPARKTGLRVEADGRHRVVDLEVAPVNPSVPVKERLYLVLFQTVPDAKPASGAKKGKGTKAARTVENQERQIAELIEELSGAKDFQQSLVEQYEATQDALTSANEELQSTNEEFQSTNEELETAKEELQATNEELVTVNEELQTRNADLMTLTSDLNNLLNSVELPILIVGSDHRIRRFTPRAEGVFKLIPTDVGRPVGDVRPDFNLDLDALTSEVMESLTLKEIETQDRNGNWMRLQVRPYRTVDNRIDGVVMSIADIDALRQRESDKASAANAASAAKDVFLATLSHELRTPLSSILTWAELIRHGKVSAEKAKHGAAVIEQNARAQAQLIDDLLDISRIIAGKLALDRKKVNPVAAIQAAVESVRPLADKKSVKLQTDLGTKAGTVLADAVRLQQILWNLLTNAIKFSPTESQVKLELRFIEKSGTKLAQIKISDSGQGIPREALPRIFDRFVQAEPVTTRQHDGLGLGLSIVRSLVELHDGTVKAESGGDGRGSVFTVTIPSMLAAAPVGAAGEIPASNLYVEAGLEHPRIDGLRVLFVDDDASLRHAMTLFLESQGATVIAAESVREALQLLKDSTPDILISDISMPQQDGYHLIREVRKLDKKMKRQTPALALTAHASKDDTQRAKDAGFEAHVAKPVQTSVLLKAIIKLTGR